MSGKFLIFLRNFLLIGIGVHAFAFLCLITKATAGASPMQASAARDGALGDFIIHYSLWTILASMVAAAFIVFRGGGAFVAGGVAIVIGIALKSPVVDSPYLSALASWARNSRLVEPAPLEGRQMLLGTPIVVNSPYGKVTIPAGTKVKVLRKNGDSVWIEVLGGETTVVTQAYLQ